MEASDCSVDLLHNSETELVAAQGEAEIIGGSHEHIFELVCDLIVDTVQAEV